MAGVFLGMRVPFPSYVGQRLADAPLFAFECVFHCQSRDSHIDRISSKSALQVFFKRLVFGRHHGDNHHRAIILRHYNAACLARQAKELLGDNFFAFSGFTPKSHAENDVPTIMNWLLPREYPCGDILMLCRRECIPPHRCSLPLPTGTPCRSIVSPPGFRNL